MLFHRQRYDMPATNRSGVCRTLLISAGLLALAGSGYAAESDIRGPDVTIIAEAEKTIYEYRQGGQLRMVRVIPKWGKPYYLVPADPTRGFGDLERADKLIPSWVIVEF
jgi:hypothetical protein